MRFDVEKDYHLTRKHLWYRIQKMDDVKVEPKLGMCHYECECLEAYIKDLIKK